MRIVVTGASGFVGRRLCVSLAEAGHEGVAVSRHPFATLSRRWRWQERNSTLKSAPAAGVPDLVIHLEVKQHVTIPSLEDCREFERINVGGTEEWLRWCTDCGVKKFVYFSTIKAVGNSDRCQDESADSLPSTPYGRSKRRAERCVLDWAAGDPSRRALIIRPAVVYGPENTANIYSMVQAIDRGVFFLAGSNANVKSLVSLTNLCAAVAYLISTIEPGCRTYYVVDQESFSVSRIAVMIGGRLGRSRPPKRLPLTLVRLAATVGDLLMRITGGRMPINSQRLHAMIESTHFSAAKLVQRGFVHPQSTEDGIAEMVRWYRKQRISFEKK